MCEGRAQLARPAEDEKNLGVIPAKAGIQRTVVLED
jgi:hypothetical protein